MENENNTVLETSENDATFDEGWGDEPAEAPEVAGEAGTENGTEAPPETAQTAQGEAGGEGQPAASPDGETAQGQAQAAQETAQSEGAQGETGGEQTETPEGFDLTVDGQSLHVDRAEVIRLAQDGAGAERQLSALNQEITALGGMETVRDVMGMMLELARDSGQTVEQFSDSTRAAMIARRDKINMDLAMERAKAERLQRAADTRSQQEAQRKAQEQARNQDFMAFMKAYPEIKAQDIPREVWDAVRSGESLVTAYSRYEAKGLRAEVDKLRAQAEAQAKAAKQNNENRQKAAPGAQSAGSAAASRDAFDEGWDLE